MLVKLAVLFLFSTLKPVPSLTNCTYSFHFYVITTWPVCFSKPGLLTACSSQMNIGLSTLLHFISWSWTFTASMFLSKIPWSCTQFLLALFITQLIGQSLDIKIQHKTIDLRRRLWGITKGLVGYLAIIERGRKPNSTIPLLFIQNISPFLKEFRYFILCFSADQK